MEGNNASSDDDEGGSRSSFKLAAALSIFILIDVEKIRCGSGLKNWRGLLLAFHRFAVWVCHDDVIESGLC